MSDLRNPSRTHSPPQMTMSGISGGTYRPCATCSRPAGILVDGKTETPAGGVTLEWEDETRSVLWITPHEAGCSEAARPNDPAGKRVTLPANCIGPQSFELNGVVFGDDARAPELHHLAAAHPLSPGERVSDDLAQGES